jgi:hypothetical protein
MWPAASVPALRRNPAVEVFMVKAASVFVQRADKVDEAFETLRSELPSVL